MATPSTTLPNVSENDLTGQWRPITITGYHGPLTSPPLTQAPVIHFDGRGHWTGTNECNRANGTYQLGDGGAFHLVLRATTKIGCRQNLPGIPDGADRIELHGAELTFFARAGAELAQYVRAGVSIRPRIAVEHDAGRFVDDGSCDRRQLHRRAVATGRLRIAVRGRARQRRDQDSAIDRKPRVSPHLHDPGRAHELSGIGHGRRRSCISGPRVGDIPSCRPNGSAPPLPVGNYQAVIYESANLVRTAPRVGVRVVSSK